MVFPVDDKRHAEIGILSILRRVDQLLFVGGWWMGECTIKSNDSPQCDIRTTSSLFAVSLAAVVDVIVIREE